MIQNKWFYYLVTSYHLVILITILISSIYYKKDFNLISRISLFGLFLFLLIWETRSRYLINYLPIMQIIAFEGVEYLYRIICVKRNSIDKINN